ncbi:hypothetical protein Ait01nite_023240 [Actinoplanes italicus]|uniref:HEAT repeat protein n=1 Tax=Actinoplanes italicus TaxID=113567 RepID=A0A2T0KGI8_9ACTN|nr:HEAT repeat domain-containing protein [Actinoplanes italicus]PRX22298.1 hypothetical protein CLV67_105475 [Actinoplanes italicus]GIE29279.1 hypothetical protein Ait01nite_023240 [Actinoplanes italicus]
MDPLSDLDGVAWGSLHGTYRSAEDVPRQIMALISKDAAVRGDALTKLSDAVVHQGTRWQVSAHVVPFLARLADDPATPDRAALVTLLRHVGLGARGDRDLPFDPVAAFDRTVTAEQEAMVVERVYHLEEEFDEDWIDVADACAVKWDADAYRATGQHLDAYRRWLGDPDPEVASPATELLAWFPLDEPTLGALLAADRDDAVRAGANLALAHLGVAPEAIVGRMTALLDHPDFAVRVTAAIALAYRLGPDLPDRALDLLVDAEERDVLPGFPPGWRDRAPRGYVALALRRLGLS